MCVFADVWIIATFTLELRTVWRWLPYVRTTAGHTLDRRLCISGNCSLVELRLQTRLPNCPTSAISPQASLSMMLIDTSSLVRLVQVAVILAYKYTDVTRCGRCYVMLFAYHRRHELNDNGTRLITNKRSLLQTGRLCQHVQVCCRIDRVRVHCLLSTVTGIMSRHADIWSVLPISVTAA